ncbi:MAG: hypothetical protein ACRDPO_11725 [Streptosporangiaceae bacterium]
MRRRVAVAAGLAVIVGVCVAVPGLAGRGHPAPPVRPSHGVTDNPPRSTPGKLTFSGTIDGQPWQFALDWNGGDIMQQGPGVPSNGMTHLSPGSKPANLTESGVGTRLALAGQVRRDVSHLVLNQPGGPAVELTAARWHGRRWVGVLLPAGLRLSTVAAYSARGEVAYAVPFRGTINAWLRPGQHGLRRQTVRIAAGTLDGKHWSFTGYAGPWGICLWTTGGASDSCLGRSTLGPPAGRRLDRLPGLGPGARQRAQLADLLALRPRLLVACAGPAVPRPGPLGCQLPRRLVARCYLGRKQRPAWPLAPPHIVLV